MNNFRVYQKDGRMVSQIDKKRLVELFWSILETEIKNDPDIQEIEKLKDGVNSNNDYSPIFKKSPFCTK